MLNSLRQDVTQQLARIRPVTDEEQQQMLRDLRAKQASMAPKPSETEEREPGAESLKDPTGAALPGFDENDPTTWGNPGRNEACPCGSGKKFKHCHGRLG